MNRRGFLASLVGIAAGCRDYSAYVAPDLTHKANPGPMTALIIARAPSTAQGFKYYIGPNGDDTNPGTKTSPWSLGALGTVFVNSHGNPQLNANNKWSTYGGQSVGLLPGTYTQISNGGVVQTLNNLANNPHFSQMFTLQGSANPLSPTYIASSDAFGNYSPRTAIIDCSTTGNVVTGGLSTCSTAECYVMGQSGYGNITTLIGGNIIIDGLVIQGFMQGAIKLDYNSGGTKSGMVVQNCEIRYAEGNNDDNPAGIWFNTATGPIATNNKIHDLYTNLGTAQPYGYYYIISFNSSGVVVTNNTCYNGGDISNKTQLQQWATMAYNYIEQGAFGNTSAGSGAAGMLLSCPSGLVSNVHHNVFIGSHRLTGDIAPNNEGTINFYNNTFYDPSTASQGSPLFLIAGSSTGGVINHYNNLYWSDLAAGYPGSLGGGCFLSAPTGFGTFDYNCYDHNFTFSTAKTGAGSAGSTFASWKTATGFDAHSTQISSTPFATTPTQLNMAAFTPSGPALTASNTGGICGAVDGSGIIGCGF